MKMDYTELKTCDNIIKLFTLLIAKAIKTNLLN